MIENRKIFEDIKAHALDRIDDAVGVYGCDLHNYLFNEDYFVVYHSEAKKIADRWDVDAFDLIEYNIEEEINYFGECYWIKEKNNLNWESQINLAAYWLGQELLHKVQVELDDCWDSELTEENIKEIRKAIEELEY